MQRKFASVLILAGGESRRMRFPKPYMLIGKDTFLNTIINYYKVCGFDTITVVLNKEFSVGRWANKFNEIPTDTKVILNPNPELGRFRSIKMGFAEDLNKKYCFIQNIDNLISGAEVINKLWEKRDKSDYVCPVHKGRRGHPVLISGKIIQHITQLEGDGFNLKNILELFRVTEVEVNDDGVLTNVNTQEDYSKVFAK